MSYANIITQAQRTGTIPGGTYGDLDYHGEPPWDAAYAAGWRKLDARAEFTPADGYRVSGYTYAQDPDREEFALEWPAVEAIPVPFPAPDSVVPVLDADGVQTGTARLLVDSSGALVIVTDSASPQRSVAVQLAEYRERAADAKAEREAFKALIKALAGDKKVDKATADAAAIADAKAAKKDQKK
jgi:hypothetical protein